MKKCKFCFGGSYSIAARTNPLDEGYLRRTRRCFKCSIRKPDSIVEHKCDLRKVPGCNKCNIELGVVDSQKCPGCITVGLVSHQDYYFCPCCCRSFDISTGKFRKNSWWSEDGELNDKFN